MSDWTRKTAAELADALAAGETTSVELTQAHLDRIAAVDGDVHAFLHIDAEGLFTAAGFYAHTREQTARFRAAVDAPATGIELEKIVRTLTRHGFTPGGDRVRTRPRGCPPDHPRLELMRHEALTAGRRHAAGPELEGRASYDLVRTDWRRLRPLVDWVEANVGPFEAE